MPSDIQTIDNWNELKSHLAEKESWLELFKRPFHEAVTDSIDIEEGCFDPLHVNQHLKSGRVLVRRLEQLEKEAFDLEIQAVKAVADYELFNRSSELQKGIEISRLRLNEQLKEREHYFSAAEGFPQDTHLGWKRYMQGLAASATAGIAEAQDNVERVSAKYEVREAYERLFHQRLMEHDNAHNYAERYTYLLKLARRAYTECIERLEAVRTAAKVILSIDLDEPGVGMRIRELVFWVENARFEIEKALERRIDERLVFSLTQPQLSNNAPLITENQLRAALASEGPVKKISFSTAPIFDASNNYSLIELGAAIDLDESSMDFGIDKLAYFRFAMKVGLPTQNNRLGIHSDRKEVLLGDAAPYGRTIRTAIARGPMIENASPKGVWSLRLQENILYNGARALSMKNWGAEKIKDIKIFIFYSKWKNAL